MFIQDLRVLKHARENQHSHVWKDNFQIFNDNYKRRERSVKRYILGN